MRIWSLFDAEHRFLPCFRVVRRVSGCLIRANRFGTYRGALEHWHIEWRLCYGASVRDMVLCDPSLAHITLSVLLICI